MYSSILQREVNEFHGNSSRVGPKPSSTKEKKRERSVSGTEERAPNIVLTKAISLRMTHAGEATPDRNVHSCSIRSISHPVRSLSLVK
jgi:hypothetical protein